MKSSLLLTIGQNAKHVSSEMSRIQKKAELSSSYVAFDAFQSHCMKSTDTILRSDDVDIIHEQVRQNLELMDMPKEINIIADLSSCFGVVDPLLDEISHMYPGLSLSAVTVDYYGTKGVGLLNAILSVHRMLDVCDFLCMRSIADSLLMLEQENIQSFSIAEPSSIIAADLFVAFSSNNKYLINQDMLFPRDVCSSRMKLVDIRSSFWKQLRVTAKQPYSPIRAMANNIHSLRNATCASIYGGSSKRLDAADFREDFPNIVHSASIMHLAKEVESRSLCSHRCLTSGTEISTALLWATPNTRWPPLGKQVLRDAASGLTPALMASQRNSRQTHSQSRADADADADDDCSGYSLTSRLSTISESSRDGAVVDESRANAATVAAMAFISPFAAASLNHMCDIAGHMCRAGAFNHRVKVGDSFAERDLLDEAIASIRMHSQ